MTEVKAPSEHDALGQKTISFFGSCVLTVNNVAGPGMLGIPLVFQQAGWLVPILILCTIYIVSSFASTMICETMNLVPGNSHYQERLEFSTVIKHYFGVKAYYVCQLFYNLSLTTMNIASILVSAQVMDEFIVFCFGQSYAIQFFPRFDIVVADASQAIPFEYAGSVILSLGYVTTLTMCMPMGFLNLDENIIFQYLSFGILVGFMGEFFWQFFSNTLHFDQVPFIGPDQSQSLGVIIFAFTYVVTVPSWCNEKMESVSVNKVIWFSALGSTAAYVLFGLAGAWAYPDMTSANILTVMGAPNQPVITQVSVYIFSVGVIALGIPLFSIFIRYNLFVGGVCGSKMSAFWGAVFPWLVGFLLYQGQGFTLFVNWSALIVNGFINFVVPGIVYIKAKHEVRRLRKEQGQDEEDDEEERALLISAKSDGMLQQLVAINDDADRSGGGYRRHQVIPVSVPQPYKRYLEIYFPWVMTVIITILILYTIALNIYLAATGQQ